MNAETTSLYTVLISEINSLTDTVTQTLLTGYSAIYLTTLST